jgi:isopentenyl diphosphate isomerase/L-lactate dehydrogenase-like FMN-dependent dehydrogenase
MESSGDFSKVNEKYKSNIKTIRKLKTRVIQNVEEAINLDEVERLAFSKLDMNTLSYYMSGASDEHTLKRNKQIFKKIFLYPKILRNVSETDTRTKILGREVSMPILIAPAALQKMACKEGEVATAKAAKEAETGLVLSSLSSSSMEEVAKVNGEGLRWFQLYVMKDRSQTIQVLKLAEQNGYAGVVITVDAPILGPRERDFQVKFKVPAGIKYENLEYTMKNQSEAKKDVQKILKDTGANSEIFEFFGRNIDASLTWEMITWLKSNTRLKIILKGVHRVDDALTAEKLGVDAIIVSNHGARQLDTVPSTIEMLRPICIALKSKQMEVYVDGGFRRGSDVFKALALGAKAVFLGRPVLWGLVSDGQKGVKKVLDLIKNELVITMKLSGCSKVSEISEDFIRFKDSFAKF